MSDPVIVFDTTLRDGEQSAGVLFHERDKIEIAERLAAMRVDVIEAGFPAASSGEARAVGAVARQIRNASVCALSRCIPHDVDLAAEALAGAACPRIHLFINASDLQLEHQLRRSRGEAVELAVAMVARAKNAVQDVEFSPMDATRADRSFLTELVRAAARAGATTINIPDTVGCALPNQVGDLIAHLKAALADFDGRVLSFHGQNDLGMATANAISAIAAGARQVEVCVNGIGERAGNASFEEVVMAIALHGEAMGVHTNIDTTGIWEVSKLVAERSKIPVPANKAIVGGNAFRHASGIHQDGVLKHRQNFECIDPARIGHPRGTQIVLGKLSGRAGFAARSRALGLDVLGKAFDDAIEAFERLAAQKAELSDEDIRQLFARQRDDASIGDPSGGRLGCPE